MYVRQFLFLYFFMSIATVFSMDVEEKPTPEVLDGIRLAHQFYAKRDIYQKKDPCFGSLPYEIQGRITAQAHSRQTVDAYWQDDLICVGEKKLPYKVCNFDVQGDSLAYFSESKKEDFYELHHINLRKFDHNIITSESLLSLHTPLLSLCGDYVTFKVYRGFSFVDKNVVRVKSFTPFLNVFKSKIEVLCFACHSSLPFCISIDKHYVRRIHNVETQYLMQERDVSGIFGNAQDVLYSIAWHPTKPICAVSKNGRIVVYGLNGLRNENENNFYGKPCFSYDGNKIWGQSRSRLKSRLRWVATESSWPGQQYAEEFSKAKKSIIIKDVAVESVGDEYVLTRDNDTHALSLQSLHDDTAKVITSLSGLKGKLHKLPDNHDYRLFVIDEVTDPTDPSKVHSIIKIFVPNSRARIEHFCLFNAALEAEKTDRAIDWNLFKKADQQLVQQTAEYYPYFKTLMVKKNLR